MYKKVVGLLMMCIIITGVTFASTYDDLVRIGLTREQNLNNTITVTFDGPHYIGNSDVLGETTYYIATPKTYIFTLNEHQLSVKSEEHAEDISTNVQQESVQKLNSNEFLLEAGEVVTFDLKYTTIFASDKTEMKINDNTYLTGFMLGQNASGKLVPINIVERQAYLKGVVPKEMPASWHIEALKAQAVAARTYSINQMHRHEDDGYDICDNTHCQVYGDISSQYPSTSLAVDETNHEILTYNDKPIIAYYHSSSGGYIENSEDVFTAPLGYIRAAYDPFSESHEGVNWSKTYSKDELTNLFNKKGYNLGAVLNVTIEDTLKSGRVRALKIWGSKDVLTLENNDIRKMMGYTDLKSTLFTIDTNTVYNIKSNNNQQLLDSSDIFIMGADGIPVKAIGQIFVKQDFGQKPIVSQSEDVTFSGKGSGHGLGLSQFGASVMANQGAKYNDILSFYYQNTQLKKH